MPFLPASLGLLILSAGTGPLVDGGGQAAAGGPLQPPSNEALQKAASQGDPRAAHDLGERYAEGRMGLPKDERRAVEWYQQAAARGLAEAQADLGWFHFHGKGGLPADAAKAFACFQPAAQQGHRYASYMLGWMYEMGRGVDQDDHLAARWHEKAANLGDMDSLAALGWLTESGRGVPKNDAAAAQMYAVAARNGNAMALNNLGWFFTSGRGGLQKDYHTAKRLFEAASSLGWARADGNLGYLHQNGLGVPKNLATALRCFKLSAEAGDLLSQQHLGHLYESGQEVERDLGLAFHYHLLSAAQGDPSSTEGLTRTLLAGYQPTRQVVEKASAIFEKDLLSGGTRFRLPLALLLLKHPGSAAGPERIRTLLSEVQNSQPPHRLLPPALRLLSGGAFGKQHAALGADLLAKAAEQGGSEAKLEWARTLIHGSASERKQAVRLLEALRDQRHPEGTFELGLLYQNGGHVQRSPSKALGLFAASADLGWVPAMFHLGLIHHQGIGVKKNAEAAKAWYRKAEAAGHPGAQGRVRPDGSLAPLDDLVPGPAASPATQPR